MSQGCCAPPLPPSQGFRKVLYFALAVNFTMFFVEIIASFHADSVSLQADALDFFGDSANYAVSLLVVNSSLSLRAKASIIKSISMALFAVFVIVNAVWRLTVGGVPEPSTMGVVAILAMLANIAVAFTLYQYRTGDSNMRSVWLCSRNDAIANMAVLVAAVGVFASAHYWPDLLVALIMASLAATSAWQVLRQARQELLSSGST